jgi:hypothetical protein
MAKPRTLAIILLALAAAVALAGQGVVQQGGPASAAAGPFTQVSAGFYYTCALRTDGTLACWGDNYAEETTPPAGTLSQVDAGGYHTCGVRTDGTVACWGDNSEGQVTSTLTPSPPIAIPSPTLMFTPMPPPATPTRPTATPTWPPVVASSSVPSGGSGWPTRAYAGLAGAGAAAVIVLGAGGWYARRRRLR